MFAGLHWERKRGGCSEGPSFYMFRAALPIVSRTKQSGRGTKPPPGGWSKKIKLICKCILPVVCVLSVLDTNG